MNFRSTVWLGAFAFFLPGCSSGSGASTQTQAEDEITAPSDITCRVLVVGGGLGGIAAAEELGARGIQTCLTEETQLLGGTYTAQGTVIDSLFSEMAESFYGLENAVLDDYRARFASAPRSGWFNPGDCRRFRSCWEPSAGARAIAERIMPAYPSVHVYLGHRATAATVIAGKVTAVTFGRDDGSSVTMHATQTIDATDLGEIYPLANVGFRVGRDRRSDFNEPSAYVARDGSDTGDPECVQRMTWVFALERTGDDNANLIPRPAGYSASKYGTAGQSFDIDETIFTGRTWWNWRRYLAPYSSSSHEGIPGAPDIASVNWFNVGDLVHGANDFAVDRAYCGSLGCSPIQATFADQSAVFASAKNHALGYLYFLQQDVVRPDGVRGYRNLRLRPDVMGTSDGLAAYPYIREGRRLRALYTITEHDIDAGFEGTRFDDSAGINEYQTDVKGCAPTALTPNGELDWHPVFDGGPERMQIPLRALIPESMNGLIAGTSKNMGVSHIANGSYRIHPGEWNAGRAAGLVAAVALERNVQPRDVVMHEATRRLVQQRLVDSSRRGSLVWLVDVPDSDRGFVAMQMTGVAGVMGGYADDTQHPDQALTRAEAALISLRELGVAPTTDCHPSFSDVPCDFFAYGAIQALTDRGVIDGYEDGTFRPGNPLTRAQLSKILALGDCSANPSMCEDPHHPPPNPGYSDVMSAEWFYPYVALNAERGYYRGADASGTVFGPGITVTRREAAIWLYNHMRLRLSLD